MQSIWLCLNKYVYVLYYRSLDNLHWVSRNDTCFNPWSWDAFCKSSLTGWLLLLRMGWSTNKVQVFFWDGQSLPFTDPMKLTVGVRTSIFSSDTPKQHHIAQANGFRKSWVVGKSRKQHRLCKPRAATIAEPGCSGSTVAGAPVPL